jgi:hypothetical protein
MNLDKTASHSFIFKIKSSIFVSHLTHMPPSWLFYEIIDNKFKYDLTSFLIIDLCKTDVLCKLSLLPKWRCFITEVDVFSRFYAR